MNDDHDPILDACLDEVLGSRTPPDLADRVLREWMQRQASAAAAARDIPDPILPPVCDPPPAGWPLSRPTVGKPAVVNLGRVNRGWRYVTWGSLALAVGLVAVITMGVLYRRDRDERAAQALPHSTDSIPLPERPSVATRPLNNSPPLANGSRAADQPAAANSTASSPAVVPAPNGPAPSGPAPTPAELPAFAEQGRISVDRLIAVAEIPAPLSESAVIHRINATIRKLWSQLQIAPPAPIADAAWRQRAFLILLGREPVEADIARFGKLTSAEQRAKMVASLMSSETYLEEFARHWSEHLTSVFLAPEAVSDPSLINRDGMLQYFRRSLLDGRPFDQVATELLTATGSGLPGATDYNGAANFLLARGGGKLEHATGDTARLFLGRNVECQQCHDDLNGGGRRQREFWELNAFFRQLAIVRVDPSSPARLTDADFLGDDKKDGHNAIVFYEQPDGLLKSAFPTFPGQGELPKSGLIAESSRRQLLARCVTTSAEFRQATTNRLWAAVFGSGLAPAEDLSSGDSQLRELLVQLADQFAAHQFNPRHVIAWAVLSEPFAVPSSDSALAIAASGSARFDRFSVPRRVSRQPVPELLVAASKGIGKNVANPATSAKIEQAAPTTKNGKIVVDPPKVAALIEIAPVSANPLVLKVLANTRLTHQQKAQHLFQLVLHRPPSRRELDLVEKILQQAGDRHESAWNAIWSALHSAAP